MDYRKLACSYEETGALFLQYNQDQDTCFEFALQTRRFYEENMDTIINELTNKDEKSAYARTKEIAAASESSSEYYTYLEAFASLLGDKNSYVRTRAFILCCCQAKWDEEGKLKQLLPAMLTLFHDAKPTVVRQCLAAAKEIVVFRPELSEAINAELDKIDLSGYKDSMTNLIRADINKLRGLIEESIKE